MSITDPTALDDRSRSLLTEAAQAGPARREHLQNEVVELNLPMARRLARRYRNRGVADDDLEQVARLGLVKSARRFDPDRRSFDAYAVPTVLGELRRYFRDSAWTVRPSRQVQDLQSAASAARETLRDGTSHEPTDHEVALEIGATDAELRHADSVQGAFSPRSLDTPSPVSGEPTGDLIGGDDPSMGAVDRLQAAAPSVRSLDPVDRRLLHMRFVEERTQQDIGRELGISQMQVSRRLTAVIGRIRDAMGLDADGQDPAA